MAKADKDEIAIYKMSTSVTYMIYMSAHDVLGFGQKRIIKLYENMVGLKNKWADNELTTQEMLNYCNSKGIDAYRYVKRVPLQSKLLLAGNKVTANSVRLIESAMLMNFIIASIILKEHFKVSNKAIKQFIEKILYYIDSYTRKQPKSKYYYLNDRMIIDIFKDEVKLDIESGELL